MQGCCSYSLILRSTCIAVSTDAAAGHQITAPALQFYFYKTTFIIVISNAILISKSEGRSASQS